MEIISQQPCSINPTSHGISDSVAAIRGGGVFLHFLGFIPLKHYSLTKMSQSQAGLKKLSLVLLPASK